MTKSVWVQIAEAVDYLNSISIYHRDLKPENFLVTYATPDGEPRVAITDFGMASEQRIALTGSGSDHYMAPGTFSLFSFYPILLGKLR